MSLDDATRERIGSLIQSNNVLLFMKGDRSQPQCGFSARVVEILDGLLPDYGTFDVLSDPSVREGIKEFSSWPTIPQLYVGGELVGGCDIVVEMHTSGELAGALGVDVADVAPPTLHISDEAAATLREMAEQRPGGLLHLEIDARFQNKLYFAPDEGGTLEVQANGVPVRMSPISASRAEGVRIGLVETDRGKGFTIDNPNAPTAVNQITSAEVKALLDAGEDFVFLDVRTPEERATAQIEGTRLLDQALVDEIAKLDPGTKLVFHCHHGGRSQAAAEHFASLGFRNVHNLVGGIDAWSSEIDPSVPRY